MGDVLLGVYDIDEERGKTTTWTGYIGSSFLQRSETLQNTKPLNIHFTGIVGKKNLGGAERPHTQDAILMKNPQKEKEKQSPR